MATQDILEFIESFCFDEQLYWRLPDVYERNQFELHWRRADRSKPWRLRALGSNNWHYMDRTQLLDTLAAEHVDMAALEKSLASAVLTQAVYANFVIEGAHKIFGESRVQKAIQETQTFLANLKETVHAFAQKRPSPEGPGADVPGLRLVAGQSDLAADDNSDKKERP